MKSISVSAALCLCQTLFDEDTVIRSKRQIVRNSLGFHHLCKTRDGRSVLRYIILTRTRTHTHTNKHTHTHTHARARTHTRMHVHAHLHGCTHTQYTHAYIHGCTHTPTHIHGCTHTPTHIHGCTHAYTHTDARTQNTRTHTYTDAHTHIHACTHTRMHTYTYTHTHTHTRMHTHIHAHPHTYTDARTNRNTSARLHFVISIAAIKVRNAPSELQPNLDAQKYVVCFCSTSERVLEACSLACQDTPPLRISVVHYRVHNSPINSGGQSLASHRGGPRSVPGQTMWDLW